MESIQNAAHIVEQAFRAERFRRRYRVALAVFFGAGTNQPEQASRSRPRQRGAVEDGSEHPHRL
jgi:hypothetical protein